MIDHLSLGTTDLSRSVEFYRRTFEPLGFALQHASEKEASFGPGTDRTFWLYPATSVQPIAGMHVAFAGPTRSAVIEAHAAACASGGTTVREPGLRPDISADYFGAIVLDPDGHRLELLVGGAM
ncbi:MAG TPA: VOC family protein [Thermoanaerobaculia bacterium]|nr:VOC family protein [Thermoanaerobaculia bacterium]